MKTKLSLKQQLFCQAYIESYGNGTEAVIKAGYMVSRKSMPDKLLAGNIASENLRKPYILGEINNLLEKAGLNDENVALQHYMLINQNEDLSVKAKAIDMYYKLKGKYNQLDSYTAGNSVYLEAAVQRIRTLLPE